jgi:hypothetical protein
MLASLCLLGSLLAPAQPGTPPGSRAQPPARLEKPPLAIPSSSPREWLLTPQLTIGQELVYRGTFTEQALGRHVQLNRTYRFENRLIVLDTALKGVELGVLTLFKDESVAGGRPAENTSLKVGEGQEARSARLEQLRLDPWGRPNPPAGVSLTVPLEGPPTLETGFCVPVPPGRIGMDKPWTVQEPGRPEMVWRVTGSEVVGGNICLRLEGEQKSEDWDKPRGDRLLWRRQDVVWVSPRSGMAQRLERRIEHRTPGHEEPDHVSLLSYDQQGEPRYPPELSEERRGEVLQTIQLQEKARPLLADPSHNSAQLDALIARAGVYLETPRPTPFREALVHLKQRLEAVRHGETPPSLPASLVPTEPTSMEPEHAAIGKPAPQFVAGDLTRPGQSVSLHSLHGKPVLLIFYNPQSHSLDDTMLAVQELTAQHPELAVVGVVMAASADRVSEQLRRKDWKMPVVNGSALRLIYGVEFTPRLVMIDTEGVIQGIVTGWGSESAAELQAIRKRWLGR